LLFNIGAFDDAIKAYSHANNINKNSDILLLRAKCYMVFKELNSALEDMEKMIELNEENNEIKFD
jgi:tetratricopeptide (TPR) repeat protein